MMDLFKSALALCVAASVLLAGCKKDKEETPDQPQLPPENAFVQDFEGFGESTSRSADNFAFAGLNVAFWNTVLYVNLVVPVTAWHKVREDQPEWNSDLNAWVWERTFNLSSGNYTAQLRGSTSGSQVTWKMYLSQEGGFQDFLWYEGVAQTNVTSGTWTIYRSPGNSQPYIGIEWHNTVGSDLDDIKYTNVIPDDAGNGGYIHYGVTADTDYEVFYDIYGIENDRLIEIRYNRTTTAGKVRDDQQFGDEEWHCWNETHEDVTCN